MLMNMVSVVGDHLAGLDIPQIWTHAGNTTKGFADNILNERDLKMGLEIHKIAAPVIRRSILPELKEYMEQHTSYVYNNLNASINKKNH